MIHKNRGNRRWTDKRKRRSKYNLVQKIWGDATTYLGGILGKYDKGQVHDTVYYDKTNGRTASNAHVNSHRMGNNYSHTDKKKVESCNDKLKDYKDGWAEEVLNNDAV